jgi:transposase-like protein
VEGYPNTEIARRCGVSPPTIGKWRRRFCELSLNGLCDDPRPGRPATITAQQIEEVLVATLESTPENAAHWSREDGRAPWAVGFDDRTDLRAFDLKPHRTDMFKLSTDPLFVEKVHDSLVCTSTCSRWR